MSNSTKTLALLPLLAVTLYVPPSEICALSITKVKFLEITFPDCDSLVQVMFGFGSLVTLHKIMACSPCLTLTFTGHWRVGCTAITISCNLLIQYWSIDCHFNQLSWLQLKDMLELEVLRLRSHSYTTVHV